MVRIIGILGKYDQRWLWKLTCIVKPFELLFKTIIQNIQNLTAPFYSIPFETSICQFNSSKFSHIIPDEVREHLTRDQRPFLHPGSLQTLQIPSSMLVLLLFSSPHSFSKGFRPEDWNGHSRSLVLCSVTNLFLIFLMDLIESMMPCV